MTHEKAREFFSAYLEETLEPALRLSLEQKLASDKGLKDEYTHFEATVSKLGEMRSEVIETPFDLNERISARLDRTLWEQKRSAPAGVFLRLRTLAFGGLAVVALIGAVASLRHFSHGPLEAGVISGPSSEQLLVTVKHDAVTVDYAPVGKSTVVFRAEPGEKPFAEITADRTSPLSRPIENSNPGTELISIQVTDAPAVEHVVLAIPGTRVEKTTSGSGTLEEFAKALAGRYRVPVKMTGVDPLTQVSWELKASDARQAAQAALKDHFSVDQREGNLVTISQG